MVSSSLVEVYCKEWTKNRKFWHLLVQNLSKKSFYNLKFWQIGVTCKVIVPIFFHITKKNIFKWSFCLFSSLDLFQCRVALYSLRMSLNSPANSVLLSTQTSPGRFFFVIMVEIVLTVSLKFFVFIPFASTVQSNKSWRTSKDIATIIFASLSTKPWSIDENSFVNLANLSFPWLFVWKNDFCVRIVCL